jgi:hypothetical protein
LPPAGDEIGQQPRGFIGQRPRFDPSRLGEVGDDVCVDRIGLGALADGFGEGADLGGVHHDHRQPCRSQGRHRDGLEATGSFQCDDARGQRPELAAQLRKSGGIALDREGFSPWAHGHVQAVFGDIDANGDDAFHADPSLPNRASP